MTAMTDAVRRAEPPPELIQMVARLAGDYCPSLSSTEVVDVARTAFIHRGDRTISEVEATARQTLERALPSQRTAGDQERG
jgi:hypothetical protein